MVVNGVNVENVEHTFVLMLLKEAKDFIHLVVRRKLNNFNHIAALKQQQQQQTLLTTAASMNNNNNGQSPSMVKEDVKLTKRRNAAIQQTAATVMANYQNSNSSSNMSGTGSNAAGQHGLNQQNANLMASTTSVSSMKPIKVTLNRKDKKEVYGVVLGCKYYIKDIIAESIAAEERNLRKGDTLLKINDLNVEQISLADARKIILKTKENKLHLTVRRNNLTATTINGGTHINVEEPPTSQTFEAANGNTYIVSVKASSTDDASDDLSSEETQPKPPPRSHSNGHHHYLNGTSSVTKMASGGQLNTNGYTNGTTSNGGGGNYHYQAAVNENEMQNGKSEQVNGDSKPEPVAQDQQQQTKPVTMTTQASSSSLKQLFRPIRNGNETMTVFLDNTLNNSRQAKFFSK